MDFQKVTEAIEKSSSEIKNLMFSYELGEKVNNIAFENNLEEDMALKLADEVSYVILGLKSRTSFFESLIETGINKDVASSIAREIEAVIFSKLDVIKNNSNKTSVEENEKSLITEGVQKSQNNIGQSFEEIILNQARAMMPARPTDESGRVTSHEIRDTNRIPENLPIKQDEPRAIHNYIGSDPYREPTE